MKYGVLFFVLMLFSLSSYSAMTARDAEGNAVTLQEAPCTAAPWLKDWKKATMLHQGKLYSACWKLHGNMVVVLDSDGDVTPVPMTAFRQETGV